MNIEKGRRNLETAEPVRGHSVLDYIDELLTHVDKSEVPVFTLKGVWNEIQDIEDPSDRAIAEGRYDKRAEEFWKEAILLLNNKGIASDNTLALPEDSLPSERLGQIIAQITDFPFANVETRSALLAKAEDKMKALQGQ